SHHARRYKTEGVRHNALPCLSSGDLQDNLSELATFLHAIESFRRLLKGIGSVEDRTDAVLLEEVHHLSELFVIPHGRSEDIQLLQENEGHHQLRDGTPSGSEGDDPSSGFCQADQLRKDLPADAIHTEICSAADGLLQFLGPVFIAGVDAAGGA